MQVPLGGLAENTLLVAMFAWVGKMIYEVVRSELRSKREPDVADIERRYNELSNKLAATTHDYVQLRTMLFGITGANGMHSEIRAVRDRVHTIEGAVGTNAGLGQALAEQVKELRRRVDQQDKRYIRRPDEEQ